MGMIEGSVHLLRVRSQVLTKFHRQEKQESTLKKNLATVLRDKQKIEETIAELEQFKRDTLTKTWEQVTKYVAFLGFLRRMCKLIITQAVRRYLRGPATR
jgi:septal ring factor EnvC (AmiA/AmiB activator)